MPATTCTATAPRYRARGHPRPAAPGTGNPGQQVLDTETKLITHAIRMAAFNTITVIGRDIRINTGYHRAADEALAHPGPAVTASGDIQTGDQTLTITLDPLPTRRATTATAELCAHLTATNTRYTGTDHPPLPVPLGG